MTFNENWDGIPRNKRLEEASADKKRNYMQAANNFVDHCLYKAPDLNAAIRGKKVFVLLTTKSFGTKEARDHGWHGFCPLGDGTVAHFISNFSSRQNYALWGSVTYAKMSKEDARQRYNSLRNQKDFEWEGELKA